MIEYIFLIMTMFRDENKKLESQSKIESPVAQRCDNSNAEHTIKDAKNSEMKGLDKLTAGSEMVNAIKKLHTKLKGNLFVDLHIDHFEVRHTNRHPDNLRFKRLVIEIKYSLCVLDVAETTKDLYKCKTQSD